MACLFAKIEGLGLLTIRHAERRRVFEPESASTPLAGRISFLVEDSEMFRVRRFAPSLNMTYVLSACYPERSEAESRDL